MIFVSFRLVLILSTAKRMHFDFFKCIVCIFISSENLAPPLTLCHTLIFVHWENFFNKRKQWTKYFVAFCCAHEMCDFQLLYYVPFPKGSVIFITGPMFKILNMWPWTTKISCMGIFVEIVNNTLYGSKLLIFLLCQKSLGYWVKIMFHKDIL